MLDNNDLKEIKKMWDSSLEDFAVIVNNGFEEQNKYMVLLGKNTPIRCRASLNVI